MGKMKKAVWMLALLFGNAGYAQTTVQFGQASDSTYGFCGLPVGYNLYFNGTTTGYTPGVDDMDISIDYGDGGTQNLTLPLSGSMFSQSFWGNTIHNYVASGQYTITVVATGSDGNDDTLLVGPIYVSAVCGTVNGDIFIDHNNNCTFDAADNEQPWHIVQVLDPNNGNIVKWGYSDANGHYSFSIPSGFNFTIQGASSGVFGVNGLCPASGNYNFLSTTGSQTFHFGYQTVNFVEVVNAMDSTSGYCTGTTETELMFYGQASGYNYVTEVIDVSIFWGDGNDTAYSVPINYQGGFNGSLEHTYTIPGVFNVLIIATAPDGLDDTLMYGPIVSAIAGCGTVEGDLYMDNNSNCVFDTGDDPMPNTNVVIKDLSSGAIFTVVYSDQNGHYTASVPSGFNVQVAANALTGAYQMPGLIFTCPSSGVYSYTSTMGNVVYNFGMYCTATQFDVSAGLNSWGLVPGDTTQVIATACNASCNPVSGTLTVTLDPLVTFVGMQPGYPAPTSINGNTLTFNFFNLNMANYNWSCVQFAMWVAVDTTVVMGDTLCFSSVATPFAGDVQLPNNTWNGCIPAFASFDPNMKEVYPVGNGPQGYVLPNTTFTYTIHFQNTGSYFAEDIYVIDTLSQYLDLTTLEILGSSHPMQVTVHSANRIKFNFPNIMLIDSTTDEPNSHGWIMYRLRTKPGLPDGIEIENTAHIYFDYNAAVVTNTTLNTISSALAVEEAEVGLMNEIYPNPANNLVNVTWNEQVTGTIQVRDIIGRLVYSTAVLNTQQITLDVSQWTAGMYQVNLSGTRLQNTHFMVTR